MDDEDSYLESRKRDPEFQKMVEEEMRKLTMELEDELEKSYADAQEPEAFVEPTPSNSRYIEPVARSHVKKEMIRRNHLGLLQIMIFL